jgi:Binding-protein-dependent transport system inner membrane component
LTDLGNFFSRRGELCWKLLLDQSHGVINQLIGQQIVWLGRPDTALASVWVVGVWQSTTYVSLILLAGLRSLPREPLEAALIDGASRRQSFCYTTFPMLRRYADRADLELRLIKLLLKDGARVVPRIAAREMHERSPGFFSHQPKGTFSTHSAHRRHSRPRVHFERRTPQFKPQPQRPRLAGGGRSHSCRNLDCERPAGHVGLLPLHAPTAYNGRVVPA